MKILLTKILFTILALWTLSVTCFAEEKPVELTIYSGIAFSGVEDASVPCTICFPEIPSPIFFREETRIDNSVLFGIKGAYFLNRKMALEGNFAVAPKHELTLESRFECPPGFVCPAIEFPFFLFRENTVSYHYGGSFVYHFTDENVRPFFSIGLGAVSTDARSEVFTDLSLNFGAGVKIYFRDFGVRFEISDHLTPNHWLTDRSEHNVQLQYGFLFRI